MNNEDALSKAIKIAREAHNGQRDKVGADYIEHPLRVMAMGKTSDEMIVGVLHDVVEDTDWTFEALLNEGFSNEVVEALRCVTKTSEDEPYDKFIARVKTNPLAVMIKLNDLTDNMDIRRLPYISDKDVKRLKNIFGHTNNSLVFRPILLRLADRTIRTPISRGHKTMTIYWNSFFAKARTLKN